MTLIEIETGARIKAEIIRLSLDQLADLKGSDYFKFDWSLESENSVYGLFRLDNDDLLGLISIIDVPEELRIHINLIESVIENQGVNKLIDGIPGCLIGFVCQMAFEKGYDGFVSLFPKTRLIDYYHNKFGFLHMGNYMVSFLEISMSIITKYLKHE